ncbi:MAG: hypothetical protein ACLR6J_03315 [Parabacteroides merdae]
MRRKNTNVLLVFGCGDRDYPVNDLVVFGDNIGTGGKSETDPMTVEQNI